MLATITHPDDDIASLEKKMRISAACVDEEININMSETQVDVEFTPQPLKFRLSIPNRASWNTVKERILAGCGVRSDTVQITYVDDEEERVQLSNEQELQQALGLAEKQGNKLRLHVTETVPGVAASNLSRFYREKDSGEYVILDKVAEPERFASCREQTQQTDVSNPPAWFFDYIESLKSQLKTEITDEVIRQLAEKIIPSEKLQAESAGIVANEPEHYGVTCDKCENAIRGIRYKCFQCSDFDLCAACESLPDAHDPTHALLKIRKPGTHIHHARKKKCSGSCRQVGRQPPNQNVNISGPPNKQEKKLQKLMKKLEKYNGRETGFRLDLGNESFKFFEPYDCQFISDDTIPDWTHVQPGTRFTKRWKVRNTGIKSWDGETHLKYCWGTLGLEPHDNEVDVPLLGPYEEGTLEVHFTAPMEPGHYQTHWRMYTPLGYFGHRLWCNVVVDPAVTLEPRVEAVSTLKVVQAEDTNEDLLHDDQNISKVNDLVELKAKIMSHTATPTNTPAGLTPLKSPELQFASRNSSQLSLIDAPLHHDTEESASVLSLSSVETEADFEVIPLPACFNLNIPFSSENQLIKQMNNTLKGNSDSDQKESKYGSVKSINLAPSCEILSEETGIAELVQQIPPSAEAADETSSSEANSRRSSTSYDSQQLNSANGGTQTDLNTNNVPQEGAEAKGDSYNNSEPKKPFSSRKRYKVEGVAQAIPEAWMTGALNAAASVYNTAKTVLSGTQTDATTQDSSQLSSREWMPPSHSSPLNQLLEMGFGNRQLNLQLLQKHDNNVNDVVAELISMNDNNWHEVRHDAPPQPKPFEFTFD